MNQDLKNKIESIISNQKLDEGEILSQLKQLMYKNELQTSSTKNSKSIADLVSANLKQLQGDTHQGRTIKTGFTDFDSRFGGFGLGEFVVIGSRPIQGRTELLVNLSLNISTTTPVLYFTFDASAFLLTAHFMSSLSGISLFKILQHHLKPEQKELLASIEPQFANHKIFVNDSCKHSITALRAHCQKHIEENGVKVIVVDSMQEMSSFKYSNNKRYEIASIARELKSIASEFNVCVIASSQLIDYYDSNFGSTYPRLSDLPEKGAIDQEADKVAFLYRPIYYGKMHDKNGNSLLGYTELMLAKNNSGDLGSIQLLIDSEFTHFRDFDQYQDASTHYKSRLNDLVAKNPNLKIMMDEFGLEQSVF